MSMARTLARFLAEQDISFDLVSHPHSYTSLETAQASHISGERLAKAVLLEDDDGYVVAVLPANYHLDMKELHQQLGRRLHLAPEPELAGVFEDCELGAVPPVGSAYGIPTVVDDQLAEQTEVFFDAGDHEQLVHVSGEMFVSMLGDAQFGHFSRHQ